MLMVNRMLAWVFIVIGVVLLIETAFLGGKPGFQVGYLAGVVFIAWAGRARDLAALAT